MYICTLVRMFICTLVPKCICTEVYQYQGINARQYKSTNVQKCKCVFVHLYESTNVSKCKGANVQQYESTKERMHLCYRTSDRIAWDGDGRVLRFFLPFYLFTLLPFLKFHHALFIPPRIIERERKGRMAVIEGTAYHRNVVALQSDA